MADVSTNIDSSISHQGDPHRSNSSATSRPSSLVLYGSFTPYFEIDSEYLKSLIGGKDNSCELVESASFKNVSGEYFPAAPSNPAIQNVEEGLSSESGIYSPGSFGVSTPPSKAPHNHSSQFFHSCDNQLSKLFSFMEFHLSKIESEVETVRCAVSKDNIHNPSHEDEVPNYLSDDSGVYEREKQLLLSLNGNKENRVEKSIDLLSRLREVLVSIQESLSASFHALDALVDMHDFHQDSKKGRTYLETKIPRKEGFEKRIDECMEDLDNEINKLYRKQELEIDGRGRVRIRSESKITIDVRQSPVSCITYFHALLFVITLGLIVYMYLYDDTQKWTVYLRLVRGPFLVLLFLYLYGVNIKVWALKHIDYVNIFDHHPKGTPTPNYVFKVAGIFCVFFSMVIIALLVSSPFTNEVPGKIAPLIMWTSLILFIVNPFKIFLRRGRFSLLLVFVRILLAPFTFVYFGDFWLADQLNSTVAILLDLQYITCYMIADTWYGNVDTSVCTSSGNGIRPVISCLPGLWRLLQCIRCYYDTRNVKHLVNAGKYFTTFPVVIFATMFATKVKPNFNILNLDWQEYGWILVLWMISAFVHAVYTFVWDVYCDWGLWDFSKGTYFRRNLVYRYRAIYLTVIVLDLLLRFAWALKVSLAIVWHLDSDLIYTGEFPILFFCCSK